MCCLWTLDSSHGGSLLDCSRDFSVGDAFVGYHGDTIPSIVMQVCNDIEEEEDLPDDTTEDTWEMKVRG